MYLIYEEGKDELYCRCTKDDWLIWKKFWEELKQKGMVKELSSNYTEKTMGICFGEYGTEDFKYGIGVER